MSLLFMTGFDYYNQSQVQRVWPYYQNGLSIVPGRFGGMGYGWNNQPGYLATPIANSSTVVLGVAFSLAYGDPTNPIIVFGDGTGSPSSPITQVDVRVTSDAGFQVTRNGTTIATSLPGLFTFGFWNYMEIKVFINNSSGYVQIRLNGSTYLNATGLNTKYTGNNYVNSIRLQPFGSSGAFEFMIDDLYVLNDTGSFNTDFLGECRIQTQYPTANGNENDFTAFGAGSNYQAVDDSPVADDDATYIRSAVVGNIDNYTMGTLALTGTIYGVQVNCTQRKDDVGSRVIAPLINTGSTTYLGSSVTCLSQYSVAQTLWQQNPNTAGTWTNTELNASFAGIKIVG
jgi:hypothetical protein